ncbi:MAG: hypothetical protein QME90_10830 [Thermodesulfobacteriota bacterium]|nr:hypothetical protein [Thermodesulfobacteriota bacterium]
MGKKFAFCLFLLTLFSSLGGGISLSQQAPREEGPPQIHLGDISFRIREVESTPSPIKLIELNIEVLNRSQKKAAPPNSVRVEVVQKEVKYSNQKPAEEFSPGPQEVILPIPLPPLTGRVLIIGFPIPKERLESITFEVQLNPPEGEKKTVKWEER